MHIYFNPLDTACKNIVGGIKEGDLLQLNIFNLKTKNVEAIYSTKNSFFNNISPQKEECSKPDKSAVLRFFKDGEEDCAAEFPMQITGFGWTISLKIKEIGLYFYSFNLEGIGFLSCGKMELGEITKKSVDFVLVVSSRDYTTPNWFKGGVMYQIFPDRFHKHGSMPDIKGRVRRDDWGGLPSYKPNQNG